MKKILLAFGFILFTSTLFAQSFVSPINFISNETNKHSISDLFDVKIGDFYVEQIIYKNVSNMCKKNGQLNRYVKN